MIFQFVEISYICILGWDFLTFCSIQLLFLEDSYCLVGPHGCNPLKTMLFPAGTHYQDYFTSAHPAHREDLPVFVQSHDHDLASVTIETGIFFPARAESVI